jgi:hypothetical protein
MAMRRNYFTAISSPTPTFIAAILAIFALQSSPAMADTQSETVDFDKWGLSLGVFVTKTDTQAQLKGEADQGSDVDLENDLGFDNSDTSFRVDGYYRFAEKHRVDFSVFDFSRNSRYVIDEEIEWQDEIYPINAELISNFDVTIYKVAYTYSFLQREKGYLGLTAGLYIADLDVGIKAAQFNRQSTGGVTAPLPVFGFRGEYQLSDKWLLRGSAEIFAFKYGDFSGSLDDIYVGIDYQLFEHTALGVGYNRVSFNLDVEKAAFNGSLDWQYSGGLVFVKFNF